MFPLDSKQLELKALVHELVESRLRPIAERFAEEDKFSPDVYEMLGEIGLYKLVLPPEWGGRSAGVLDLSVVTEEISRVSGAATLYYFPTQAVMRVVLQTADEEQMARWLPEFAKGDKLAAFCLTEPNYGSDAGSLMTRAVLDGDEYVINGTKTYITLGENADYYLVFVRTGPGARTAGISAFIIDHDAPGLSFGHKERKMGLGGSVTQEMIFQDCRVPAANLLLGEGRGWEVLTATANPMRLWGAASLSLGIAQGAFELAVEHAGHRRASGHKINRYQAVQFTVADMATKIEAARSLIRLTAARIDRGDLSHAQSEKYVSMGKICATDVAMEVTTEAVQIFGRLGVSRGHPIERLFRDAKAVQIFDGSNQVQRLIVARHSL